jgi:hypothetical protein
MMVDICTYAIHYFQISNMTQPIYDTKQGGFRVFIGNLGARTNISELQHECERYGPLVDCWVAR